MKLKYLAILLICSLITACSANAVNPTDTVKSDNSPDSQAVAPVELHVFAAASLTETFEKISKAFEAANPDIKVILTFDSSGTLKTQIQQGADADLFVSAAQKQMNQLEAGNEANTESLDCVLKETPVNLLENQVTLVVPTNNPAGVSSFADLGTDKVNKIALGNKDVPVGQYSEELLTNLGIWDAIQPKVTFGSNVKEVTTWVKEGVADCGIVYATDAFSAGLEIVDRAAGDLLKTKVIYPGAVLTNSKHVAEAKAFLDYLQTPEAQAVFEAVGFAIPDK